MFTTITGTHISEGASPVFVAPADARSVTYEAFEEQFGPNAGQHHPMRQQLHAMQDRAVGRMVAARPLYQFAQSGPVQTYTYRPRRFHSPDGLVEFCGFYTFRGKDVTTDPPEKEPPPPATYAIGLRRHRFITPHNQVLPDLMEDPHQPPPPHHRQCSPHLHCTTQRFS